MTDRIPVTVLTGYLGAGKTTLVNRILAGAHGRRIAVVVNELAEAGIDGDLIVAGEEELVELANGCICCTVRGDLVRTVRNLLTRPGRLDAILVETTGLAAPGPVAQTFLVDPALQAKVRLDSITTLVDAKHIDLRLDDSREAAEQVAFADQIVLNKTELVDAVTLDGVERRLRRLNPLAPIHRAVRSDVPLEAVLGRGSFDLDRLLTLEPALLGEACGAPGHVHDETCGHDRHDDHHHQHDRGRHDHHITSVSLVSHAPMDEQKIEAWIAWLVETRGREILRLKGIIDVAGVEKRLVVQAVHMQLEGDLQRPWKPGETRQSRLVLIGRNLDPAALQRDFAACAVH
jgi:G3E family GTPase